MIISIGDSKLSYFWSSLTAEIYRVIGISQRCGSVET